MIEPSPFQEKITAEEEEELYNFADPCPPSMREVGKRAPSSDGP